MVSIPSKSGHYSRRPNAIKSLALRLAVSIPSKSGHYSRLPLDLVDGGVPPEVSIPSKSGHYSRQEGRFQSCNRPQVSIPSKSGHYSRHIHIVTGGALGMFQSPLSRGTTPDLVAGVVYRGDVFRFQSPLSRGTTPDKMMTEFTPEEKINVSIPSKSGHYSRRGNQR